MKAFNFYKSDHNDHLVKAHQLRDWSSNLIELENFFSCHFACQILNGITWWNCFDSDWTYTQWATWGDWIVEWEDKHISILPDAAFTRIFKLVEETDELSALSRIA